MADALRINHDRYWLRLLFKGDTIGQEAVASSGSGDLHEVADFDGFRDEAVTAFLGAGDCVQIAGLVSSVASSRWAMSLKAFPTASSSELNPAVGTRTA